MKIECEQQYPMRNLFDMFQTTSSSIDNTQSLPSPALSASSIEFLHSIWDVDDSTNNDDDDVIYLETTTATKPPTLDINSDSLSSSTIDPVSV